MLFFKKNFIIFSVSILLILVFFGFSSFCLAQANQLGGLEKTANRIGYGEIQGNTNAQISLWIGMIVKALVGFIGVIFMILIWMGALDIIGAGGNEEDVKKGKDKIKNGAIGVLIVFSAYLLTNMILSMVSGGDLKIFKF